MQATNARIPGPQVREINTGFEYHTRNRHAIRKTAASHIDYGLRANDFHLTARISLERSAAKLQHEIRANFEVLIPIADRHFSQIRRRQRARTQPPKLRWKVQSSGKSLNKC
jgi:hypothetical protein